MFTINLTLGFLDITTVEIIDGFLFTPISLMSRILKLRWTEKQLTSRSRN